MDRRSSTRTTCGATCQDRLRSVLAYRVTGRTLAVEVIATKIPDVLLVKPKVFGDHRGYFLETWHETRFRAAGIGARFVQDNHSRSTQWTLRGLHYQIESP